MACFESTSLPHNMYIIATFIAYVLMLIIISFMEDYQNNTHINPLMNNLESTVHRNKIKYILQYTTFHQMDKWGPKTFSQCPVPNCVITRNSRELRSASDFDAIMFHYRDLEQGTGASSKMSPKWEQWASFNGCAYRKACISYPPNFIWSNKNSVNKTLIMITSWQSDLRALVS